MTALPVPSRIRADLHVAFTGDTAEHLRAMAQARGENPTTLARALLKALLISGFETELLDGARADQIADGHGRRPFAGIGPDGAGGDLTMRQCAVTYLIGLHGGEHGWCGWSVAALTRAMPAGTADSVVAGALDTLIRKGVVTRGPRQPGAMPTQHRLTAAGRAVFVILAGEREGSS